MPPPQPSQVAKRFALRIRSLTRDFDELLIAIHAKRREASLKTMLSEQTAMSIAVLWEAFISDLIMAYVVGRPAPYLNDLENRVRKSLDDKFPGTTRWITCQFPFAISRNQAEKLLDPRGWNIAPKSAQELADIANRLLEGSDAKKFSLAADDRDFIDYLICLRNYLGHRSSGARSRLVSSVAGLDVGGVNAPLTCPLLSFT